MSMRRHLTLIGVALASTALSATLVAPADAHPRHGDHGQGNRLNQIELPAGFQPEGITIGKRGTAYLGSRGNGDIYAVDLRSGVGSVISQGPETPSVGLKVRRDRLYVAGGSSGTARVISTRTGAVLASYPLAVPAPTPTDPSFVNDVALAKDAAYFTDSRRAVLYRVSYARDAEQATVTRLPLTGDWEQVPGFNNANGIVVSPDRQSLLVVQSVTGFLFRVDPATGVARRVDLGTTSTGAAVLLTNGDGLLLRGTTLYAVQNRLNQIAVVRLDGRATRGRLVDTLTSADLPEGTSFDVPTTVAAYRGSLYLPNARFGTANPTTIDYWISRIKP